MLQSFIVSNKNQPQQLFVTQHFPFITPNIIKWNAEATRRNQHDVCQMEIKDISCFDTIKLTFS